MQPPMRIDKTAALTLVLVIVLAAEARVDAYLDPGSGSMLVQLLIGGVAGLAVIVRLYWRRMRDWVRSPRLDDRKQAPTREE